MKTTDEKGFVDLWIEDIQPRYGTLYTAKTPTTGTITNARKIVALRSYLEGVLASTNMTLEEVMLDRQYGNLYSRYELADLNAGKTPEDRYALIPETETWVVVYAESDGEWKLTQLFFTTPPNETPLVNVGNYIQNWYEDFSEDFSCYSKPQQKEFRISYYGNNKYFLRSLYGIEYFDLWADFDPETSTLYYSGQSLPGPYILNTLVLTTEEDEFLPGVHSAGIYVYDENKNPVDHIIFDVVDGYIRSSKYTLSLDLYTLNSNGAPEDFVAHATIAPMNDPMQFNTSPDSNNTTKQPVVIADESLKKEGIKSVLQ
ncbi:MAG: hypothetical protein LUH15_15780 [Tannerellaceae bacterium]|nr:hypothetical protein [Tannerellaceae bacterium]